MSLVARVKHATKRTLLKSRILRTATRLAPAGAVVLMYHSVQNDPAQSADVIGPAIAHPASLFDRQMECIARQFNPVALEEIDGFLSKRRRLPARAVAVTFDDGFRDNFEVAAPILARYGIPATFYITAGCVDSGQTPWFCRIRHAFQTTTASRWAHPLDFSVWDLAQPAVRAEAQLTAMRRAATLAGRAQDAWVAAVQNDLGVSPASPALENRMLTWDQVRSLERAGHTIGSHTMSHPNLAHVEPAEARHELEESKRLLEDGTQGPVEHFSYPCAILWPHWNAETASLTAAGGYRTVATTATGPVRRGADPLLVPRVAAPMEMESFCWALEISLLGHRV